MRFIFKVLNIFVVIALVCGIWNIGSAGKIYAKAWLAQILLEQAWQKTLKGETNVRPWPWADTWPVAELTVPRLGIRRIVLSGDSGRVLAFSPGHTEASAFPGHAGNTVISGHRDTHFKFLQGIKEGDRVELKTAEATYVYNVSDNRVVDQRYFWLDATSERSPTDQFSEGSLILVTCYPFDALQSGGHERFIVLAEQSS